MSITSINNNEMEKNFASFVNMVLDPNVSRTERDAAIIGVMALSLKSSSKQISEIRTNQQVLQESHQETKKRSNNFQKMYLQKTSEDEIKVLEKSKKSVKSKNTAIKCAAAGVIALPLAALIATPAAPAAVAIGLGATCITGMGAAIPTGFAALSNNDKVKGKIAEKDKQIWVLKNFPEAVGSPEIKEKALLIRETFVNQMAEAESKVKEPSRGRNVYGEDDADGLTEITTIGDVSVSESNRSKEQFKVDFSRINKEFKASCDALQEEVQKKFYS